MLQYPYYETENTFIHRISYASEQLATSKHAIGLFPSSNLLLNLKSNYDLLQA